MTSLDLKPETLQLIAFVSVLVVMSLAEIIQPRRQLLVKKAERWRVNLAMVLLNTMLLRLVFPLAPVALAALIQANGWGALNLLKMTGTPELVISLLLLDLIIYFQHRMFHKLPVFWRIHRMHHTDIDLDVSSGIRFHPLEMTVSMLIKLAAVCLIGPTPLSVLVFEIMLNASSMFNHANLHIPEKVDRWLRLVLVTPDMHRVHHSVLPLETDSNYGFNLPWWDRLFGSYRSQPRDGHQQMQIGLKEFRNPEEMGLKELLLLPFANSKNRKAS
jgi:sterol desaturase/sphingolipid hydroxylase (fatty acid hydroxylase superfamily)